MNQIEKKKRRQVESKALVKLERINCLEYNQVFKKSSFGIEKERM